MEHGTGERPTVELITGSYTLARRLEASDALNAALAAEAQARRRPSSGSTAITVAGGSVAFAGVGSPLTHAIGVGMSAPVSSADLDQIESFYRERGSQINIDLCPLADPSLLELLGQRGYRCVEFNNVMVRRIAIGDGIADSRVELAPASDTLVWSRLLAEGFFEHEPTVDEIEIGSSLIAMDRGQAYMMRVDGVPASGGAMAVHPDGTATLFGDATLKAYRGRGLQTVLINARLAAAAAQDAHIATAATLPGSVSHRNYERCGFRVAYTKLNMQLD